jgi:hypothetical protein
MGKCIGRTAVFIRGSGVWINRMGKDNYLITAMD